MNNSLRRGVPPVSERPARCVGCRHNKHRECDLRINEGAVDAEDFISVSCKCPCEGEVTGQLIDLVSTLRLQIKALTSVADEEKEQEGNEIDVLRSLITCVEEFFQTGINDEGTFDLRRLREMEDKLGQFRAGVYDGE